MAPEAIIFDFDGVVVDSEMLSNRLLAEALTAAGMPTSYDDSLDLYYGHRWADTVMRIEARHGCPLPEGFRAALEAEYHRDPGAHAPIAGVVAFLERAEWRRRAIASSSSVAAITSILTHHRLDHHFAGHVYSAADQPRGKPHPDVYLAAASGLGVDPTMAVVIEDSPTGAAAGVAAGMTVIGLLAGGHVRAGHDEQLRAVGVRYFASDYREVAAILATL